MTRRLLGALLTAVTATVLLGVTPANAAAANFAGTVALSNCSGSVVKPAATPDTAPALVMSNGHCLESGFPGPGQVITNQTSTRTFTLLTASGSNKATLRAKKIIYGTMTDTDVSLYQLTTTYAQIKSNYGISPLELSNAHPTMRLRDRRRLRLLEARLLLQHRRVRLPAQGGQLDLEGLDPLHLRVPDHRRDLGLSDHLRRQGRRRQQHRQRRRPALHGEQPVRGRPGRQRHRAPPDELRRRDLRHPGLPHRGQRDRPHPGRLHPAPALTRRPHPVRPCSSRPPGAVPPPPAPPRATPLRRPAAARRSAPAAPPTGVSR